MSSSQGGTIARNHCESLIIALRNPTGYEIMEVLEAIKSGKSVSKFKPTPDPEQKNQAEFNATRLAAAADNLQPRNLIVVNDKDIKKQAAASWTYPNRLSKDPV